MTTPPTGTVTFLFTDIEGSTQRWESQRAAMERALDRHNALVRGAVDSRGGYVFHTAGDALCVAFASASGALAAAVEAQRALATEDWSAFAHGFQPLRVRMALHTGTAELREGDYFGPPLNRTARLMATGHGGQILLSLATEQLVRDELPAGVQLRDLGIHRLKDLRHSEHIFRLVVEDLPDVATPPDTAAELRPAERAHFDAELLPTECPYRGLFAFREEDAPFFFGREAFTQRLAETVRSKRMVGVIGSSGSGKSSVVFAGLVPRLRAEGSDGGGHWTFLDLRPGPRPFHALAGVLVPLLESDLAETDRLVQVAKMAKAMQAGDLDVPSILQRVADKRGALGRVVLVADQFEELYTLCPDPDLRHRFLDTLFEAVAVGDWTQSVLTLVLTLRADFMGHALAYRPFSDALQDHQLNIGPMTREELTRAIVNPAEKQGRSFESGLAERMLTDVGAEPGNLPLLEFALTTLWERQSDGWLTHAGYDAIGRVEGALAGYADGVYGDLPAPVKESARQVFVQLVRPGEGTEDTRRLATHGELGELWPLVRRLADSRLVVTDRDAGGMETAEVVHEALIRSWGQLRAWMDANRTFRTWQERLRFALRQWETTGRDEGALLRGAPLAEAEGWLKERGGELSAGEREFVDSGVMLRDREAAALEAARQRELELERQRAEAEGRRAEEQAAAARKLRQRAVLLAGAMVVAAGLALAAVVLAQQARANAVRANKAYGLATARELAAASKASLEQDPELSAILALHAISASLAATDTAVSEAQEALHLALQNTRGLLSFTAHVSGVLDMALSPDGTRIVTSGRDGIKVWERTTGRKLLEITEPMTSVSAVAVSPNGRQIASGSPDGIGRLWDAPTGGLIASFNTGAGSIRDVAFSPDGTQLAIAGNDKLAEIWDVAIRVKLVTLTGHTGFVGALAWSPNGKQLATASDAAADRAARIWDVETGRLLSILSLGGGSLGVTFNPDGTQLLTGGAQVEIWDLRTGALINVLRGHDDPVTDVAVRRQPSFPSRTQLLTASTDKSAALWDRAQEGPNTRLMFRLAGHTDVVRNVAFTPDHDQAVTSGGDGSVRVWDITPGQAWRTLYGHAGDVGSVAFNNDGTRIATASADGTARIWDVESAVNLITFTGHITNVDDIAFSPDGTTVVSGGRDGTAKLWSAGSGELVQTFEGHKDWVTGVAFSRDGRRIATASKDATARVWDVQSGGLLLTLTGHTAWINKLAFSPDGTRIATASDDGTAKVWDAATGEVITSFAAHRAYVGRVSFSPDGRTVATTSDSDRSTRLWDAATGRQQFQFSSQRSRTTGVDFSPDGRQLAATSWDGTVKLWDARSGEELMTVARSSLRSMGLRYSPDGTHIAVGSQNGYAYVYTLRLDELFEMAHQRISRTLSPRECRVFLHLDVCPPLP